MTAQKFVEISV